MRVSLFFLGVLFAFCIPVFAFAAPSGLLVPAYFDPTSSATDWKTLNTTAATGIPLIAIANPNSWPGKKMQESYSGAIRQLRASGWKVIGYVHTSYGARSLKTVLAEVTKWNTFYPIDGIFIDEMSTSENKKTLEYYAKLYAGIKAVNANFIVVGNPGTRTPKAYFDRADILVTFESSATDYTGTAGINNDIAELASTKQAALVYDVTDTKATWDIAKTRHAGYIYLTDRTLNTDPWAALWSIFSTVAGYLKNQF